MTNRQAIDILMRLNAWRTGNAETYEFTRDDFECAFELAYPIVERKTADRLKKYVSYITHKTDEFPDPKQVTLDINSAICALQKKE